MVDTPVSIPNTEVKHHSGDDTRGTGENSALLGFFSFAPLRGIAFNSKKSDRNDSAVVLGTDAFESGL